MDPASEASSSRRRHKASRAAHRETSQGEARDDESSRHTTSTTRSKRSGAKRRHRKRQSTRHAAHRQDAPEVSGFHDATSGALPLPLASSSLADNEVACHDLWSASPGVWSPSLFSPPFTPTTQPDWNLDPSAASPYDGTPVPQRTTAQRVGEDVTPGREGGLSVEQGSPEPLLQGSIHGWLRPGNKFCAPGGFSPASGALNEVPLPTEIPFGNAPPLSPLEKIEPVEISTSPKGGTPPPGSSAQHHPEIASFHAFHAGLEEPSSFVRPTPDASEPIPPATKPSAPSTDAPQARDMGPSYYPSSRATQGKNKEETPSSTAAWQTSLKMPSTVNVPGLTPTEEPTLDEKEWKIVCALAVFTAALLAATAVAALMVRRKNNKEPQLCTREDCLAHAIWLSGRINHSVDPCEDFSAFTCAAWKPSTAAETSKASAQDLLTTWFTGVAPLLQAGAGRVLAAAKAYAAFRTCMNPDFIHDIATMASLRDFMRERHIPWPEVAVTGVSPLGVLLDLAFNWQLPFWMSLRLQRDALAGLTRTLLSKGKYVPFWASHHMALISRHTYESYWGKYQAVFARDGAPLQKADQARKMAAMMTDVLERLLAVEKRKTPKPARFQLQNITKLTGNISLETWMAALNESVKLAPHFNGTEMIYVSDVALLQAVDALFGRYSRIELLQHIGWFFVLALAPLGNISMLEEGLIQTSRPVFCASEVEASYGVLLASMHVRARFPKEERSEITLALGNITEAALDKMGTLRWSKDVPKLAALKRLKQVKVVLWPPEQLLTLSGLNEMYAAFLPDAYTFVTFWLDGHRRLRELKTDNEYNLALTMPRNSQLPLLDYDRLLDTVAVSVAALSPPVYYGRSTPAMLYSGLGFAFAEQLVKALDNLLFEIDPSGELVADTWESAAWSEAVTERRQCLVRPDFKAAGVQDIFPEVPALELAHAAFLSALDRGRSLKTAQNFTEEQAFFVAICRGMCDHREGRVAVLYGADCNKAVRNFPPFASAFGCREGSRMNPSRKCSFF